MHEVLVMFMLIAITNMAMEGNSVKFVPQGGVDHFVLLFLLVRKRFLYAPVFFLDLSCLLESRRLLTWGLGRMPKVTRF